MRLEIIGLQKLHRMRRHHRQLQFRRQCQRPLHTAFKRQMRATQALQFDVEALREQLRPRLRPCFGLTLVAGEQRMADVAMVRAGKRDQIGGAAVGKPRPLDFRAAAPHVFAIRARQQLAQPQVAVARLRQQQQSVRLVAVGVVFDPGVAADDRLDAGTACLAVEFDQAEQIGQIGQRQRRHAVGRRAAHRLVDAYDTIRNRVLAVQPQVDEGWLAHVGAYLINIRACLSIDTAGCRL